MGDATVGKAPPPRVLGGSLTRDRDGVLVTVLTTDGGYFTPNVVQSIWSNVRKRSYPKTWDGAELPRGNVIRWRDPTRFLCGQCGRSLSDYVAYHVNHEYGVVADTARTYKPNENFPGGRVIAMSGQPGPDFPALRRSQVAAHDTDVGLSITKRLLGAKLSGQRTVVDRYGARIGERRLAEASDALNSSTDSRQALATEAQAASVYWVALADRPVRFADADAGLIPRTLVDRGGASQHPQRQAAAGHITRSRDLELPVSLGCGRGVAGAAGAGTRPRPRLGSP